MQIVCGFIPIERDTGVQSPGSYILLVYPFIAVAATVNVFGIITNITGNARPRRYRNNHTQLIL